MSRQFSIKGLYAVTPDEIDTKALCSKVEASLLGGVKLLQYRNKVANADLRLQQASALLALCRKHNVPLIINDHLDLCTEIDADGLHLGATDCDLGASRRLLGADKIIGASCYNQINFAHKAQSEGASYVAFGACFPTNTKSNTVNAPLSLFAEAKNSVKIPIVAIGGITLENAGSLKKAGADAIAVVNALFNAKDIKNMAQQLTENFKS
ncbi:MAG: thiamine phosphate synthase [Methylophilaceae bacterium]